MKENIEEREIKIKNMGKRKWEKEEETTDS